MKTTFGKQSLALGLLALSLSVSSVLAANRSGPTLVVFNANWCASCRDIVPIVRDVASQNKMAVEIIDVDMQEAPKLARSYGLSVPSSEPPQVYLVDRGKVNLIYNGRDFRFGFDDVVRATLLQNIRQGGK